MNENKRLKSNISAILSEIKKGKTLLEIAKQRFPDVKVNRVEGLINKYIIIDTYSGEIINSPKFVCSWERAISEMERYLIKRMLLDSFMSEGYDNEVLDYYKALEEQGWATIEKDETLVANRLVIDGYDTIIIKLSDKQ